MPPNPRHGACGAAGNGGDPWGTGGKSATRAEYRRVFQTLLSSLKSLRKSCNVAEKHKP